MASTTSKTAAEMANHLRKAATAIPAGERKAVERISLDFKMLYAAKLGKFRRMSQYGRGRQRGVNVRAKYNIREAGSNVYSRIWALPAGAAAIADKGAGVHGSYEIVSPDGGPLWLAGMDYNNDGHEDMVKKVRRDKPTQGVHAFSGTRDVMEQRGPVIFRHQMQNTIQEAYLGR